MSNLESVTPSASNHKTLLASILIFIITFAILLALSEFVVSKIKKPLVEVEPAGTYYQFNIRNGIEPKPGYKYREYDLDVSINENGFYGPIIPKEKKGLRLAFLGDSYSAGPGIKFEENYPFLINQKINADFPNTDYVIGGLGGSSPSQQDIILRNKIVPYNPDIVIYELYENDLADDFIFSYSQYYSRMKVFRQVPEVLRQFSIVQQLMIITMDNLTKANSDYYESHKNLLSENPSFIWDNYTEPALDSILLKTKEIDAKFVLFFIPLGWEFDSEYEAGSAKEKPSVIHESAKKWAEKKSIPYVDMREIFSANNTEMLNEIYLPGEKGYHLTPLGAKLVADEVHRLVRVSLGK